MDDMKKDQHFWHIVTSATYILLMLIGTAVLVKLGKLPYRISAFDFSILVFASFRVTRLLVHDLVLDFVRYPFESATSGFKLTLHDLLDCPWCTGTWVTLFLGFLYFLTPLAWPFLLIMAISGIGTLLTIIASLMTIFLEEKDGGTKH